MLRCIRSAGFIFCIALSLTLWVAISANRALAQLGTATISGNVTDSSAAVVVGASEIAGKPIALLLTEQMATVTLCHIETKDLFSHTRRADRELAVRTDNPGARTYRTSSAEHQPSGNHHRPDQHQRCDMAVHDFSR